MVAFVEIASSCEPAARGNPKLAPFHGLKHLCGQLLGNRLDEVFRHNVGICDNSDELFEMLLGEACVFCHYHSAWTHNLTVACFDEKCMSFGVESSQHGVHIWLLLSLVSICMMTPDANSCLKHGCEMFFRYISDAQLSEASSMMVDRFAMRY